MEQIDRQNKGEREKLNMNTNQSKIKIIVKSESTLRGQNIGVAVKFLITQKMFTKHLDC